MEAFKKNFKQSFLVGIISIIFIAASIFTTMFFMLADESNYILLAMSMSSGAVFMMMNFYIYPQIVCLHLKLPAIIKNALLLAIIGLKNNLITLFCILVIASAFIFLIPMPIWVLIFPFAPFSWIAFLAVFNAYPVMQTYIINPYYEAKGETNPELLNHDDEQNSDSQSLFTDLGGKESVINKKKLKTGGKVIK